MKRRNVGGVGATWFVQLCIFGCFLMAMVGERPADGLIFFYFLYGLQTIAALRAARGSDLIETVLRLATVGLVGVTMGQFTGPGTGRYIAGRLRDHGAAEPAAGQSREGAVGADSCFAQNRVGDKVAYAASVQSGEREG